MEDSWPGNAACQQPLVTLGVTAPLQLHCESVCLTGEQWKKQTSQKREGGKRKPVTAL